MRILHALREWFRQRDFVEVETPILQVSPGNELHLHALSTELHRPDGTPRAQRFLHTSPEFTMKKLLAAGERRIFSFARCFRDREQGSLHAAEFTMLEWYRVGEAYETLMDDCAQLLRLASACAGSEILRHGGLTTDPSPEPERLSVADAFQKWAGIDIHACPTTEEIAQKAHSIGIRVAADDGWSDIFTRILVERIEPHLGKSHPTILMEYPLNEAALARPKPGDPRVAERFELYVCGLELANAFGELTDAVEQRRRFEADMAEKERIYGVRYPIDPDFLDALAKMPEASGIALGFDRLVMLAVGAPRIEDVVWGMGG